MRRVLVVATIALVGIVACGDSETNDKRGYTKAPLEKPGLRIQPEKRSDMDRLGQPVLPVGDTVTVPVTSN